jgi:hypothetical protein
MKAGAMNQRNACDIIRACIAVKRYSDAVCDQKQIYSPP